MYTIIQEKKSEKILDADYIFKDFESFYELAKVVTVPLVGMFNICIQSDKVKDIQDFVKVADKYAYMNIRIYAAKSTIEYISLYNPTLIVNDSKSAYDIFKELIEREQLLFAKGLINVLYASIEHDYETMDDVVKRLREEFGAHVTITEPMLAKHYILNKTVYPRSVMLAYLRCDRWRRVKLKQCLEEVGNDIAVGAVVKNIKLLLEEKVKYFKSGNGSNLIKSIDTQRLLLMYRVFVVERNGLDDLCLLLELYERGISVYDIVQRRTD